MSSTGCWTPSIAAVTAVAVAVASCVALTAAATSTSTSALSVSRDPEAGAASASNTPQLVKEFNAWVNGFLFPDDVFEWARGAMGPKAAHYFLTYVRNFLGGSILYYVTASIWHW